MARFNKKIKFASRYALSRCHALLVHPLNAARRVMADRKFVPKDEEEHKLVRRIMDYDYSLLPNKYVASLESETGDMDAAMERTGLSLGYPGWNLLYYSLLCSLPAEKRKVVVVETGTNHGFSTIVLAQALKDMDVDGRIYTVDIDEEIVGLAKQNVEKAGLSKFVEFHVQDSLAFLSEFTQRVDYIDFAFLDGNHRYSHVQKEFSIIYPKIVSCKGKVYFDNTTGGATSVARALYFIRRAYGGNIVEFRNCSGSPPGNVIWQP